MRFIALTVLLLCPAIGLAQDRVALDLPLELRCRNWGGGSCVHASTVNLWRNAKNDKMADWWRQEYSGGEYSDRLIDRLRAAGADCVYTKSADIEFLKWACSTGRGAGIFYKPSHAINVAAVDDEYVYLLDNNYVNYLEKKGNYEKIPIDDFVRAWKGYGGFAWALRYKPLPPRPYQLGPQ